MIYETTTVEIPSLIKCLFLKRIIEVKKLSVFPFLFLAKDMHVAVLSSFVNMLILLDAR